MSRARWRAAAPCAASAVLLLLAFPPFNLGLLTFVALVPWLASVRGTSPRGAWRRGYLFGLLFALGQVYWLGTLAGRWTGSPALGVVPWILCALAMAVYFGLLGRLVRTCWERDWLWAIPLVWAGMEVFRSYIPVLAFPWGLLATPLWPYPPVIQGAHYGSIALVSGWVATINTLLATWLVGAGSRRPLVSLAVAGLVLTLYGYGTSVPTETRVVSVGQPGVDMAFDQAAELRLGPAVANLQAEARRQGASLLVLPEGVAKGGPTLPPSQVPFPIDPGLPMLFGGQRGPVDAKGTTYQSAFAWDGKGWQTADKTRLVIFGEFVPGRDVLPFVGEAFHLPGGDLSAGDKLSSVTFGDLRVGPLICFEALFPDLAYRQAMGGARMLAVMSIDDWFMGTIAPEELRTAAVWRAVETGLPLVRSGSLGYTMAVDGKGRFLAAAPLGQNVALRVEVPVPQAGTVFPLLPVFPALAAFSLVAVPAAARWSRRSGTKETE